MYPNQIAFVVLLLGLSWHLNATEATIINRFNYPRIAPSSISYKVKTGDIEHKVMATKYAGAFASFESNGAVSVSVEVTKNIKTLTVLPLSLGITPDIEGNIASFDIPLGKSVIIEVSGLEKCLISNHPIAIKPDLSAPEVIYYKSGQVYEVGELLLQSNQTLYIEGGAIIRGKVLIVGSENVTVAGYGVIDGNYYENYDRPIHPVFVVGSKNVTLSQFTIINPQAWCITLSKSSNIMVDRVTALSLINAKDGLDIVGCKDVLAQNCVLMNGDDCVAIKSFNKADYFQPNQKIKPIPKSWSGVTGIEIRECVLQPNIGGHAFEIGHELLKAEGDIRNIVFKDTDVIGAHGKSSIFGIHAYDGASIYNITYENISVDHYYNKLIDFRISKSRYSSESTLPDRVSDILLKDIRITNSIYNPGYSISVIGGFDKDHLITNITFDNFQIDGQKIASIDDDKLALFTKHIKNVTFK